MEVQLGSPRQTTPGKSSPYRGVSWHKGAKRWQAQISYRGTIEHLGYFDDEYEAACVYDKRAREIYGRQAILNRHLAMLRFLEEDE